MARYAMVTDLGRCVACHACTAACNGEWDVPAGYARTQVRQTPVTGTFPKLTSSVYVAQCNHCDRPSCVPACPSGATYQSADGVVRVDNVERELANVRLAVLLIGGLVLLADTFRELRGPDGLARPVLHDDVRTLGQVAERPGRRTRSIDLPRGVGVMDQDVAVDRIRPRLDGCRRVLAATDSEQGCRSDEEGHGSSHPATCPRSWTHAGPHSRRGQRQLLRAASG